jgi:hypothetical protein
MVALAKIGDTTVMLTSEDIHAVQGEHCYGEIGTMCCVTQFQGEVSARVWPLVMGLQADLITSASAAASRREDTFLY